MFPASGVHEVRDPRKHLKFLASSGRPGCVGSRIFWPDCVLSHTLLLAGTTSELSESLTPKLQVKHGEALTRRDTEGDEGDGCGQHIMETLASARRQAPTWPPGGARAVGGATPGAAEHTGQSELPHEPVGRPGKTSSGERLAVSPKGTSTSHSVCCPVAISLETVEACVHMETHADAHSSRTVLSHGNTQMSITCARGGRGTSAWLPAQFVEPKGLTVVHVTTRVRLRTVGLGQRGVQVREMTGFLGCRMLALSWH